MAGNPRLATKTRVVKHVVSLPEFRSKVISSNFVTWTMRGTSENQASPKWWWMMVMNPMGRIRKKVTIIKQTQVKRWFFSFRGSSFGAPNLDSIPKPDTCLPSQVAPTFLHPWLECTLVHAGEYHLVFEIFWVSRHIFWFSMFKCIETITCVEPWVFLASVKSITW